MGSRDELRAFFDKVVARRAEGLMIKLLEGERREGPEEVDEDGVADEDEGEDDNEEEDEGDQDESADKSRKKPLPATYEPDQRSMGWLKVKKGELPANSPS
jgi:DNA ligase-1